MNQNFRSAFNGFNREDVVHYLEYINNKHAEQVSQLSSDADFLRQKLHSLAGIEDQAQVIADLRAELEALQKANAELTGKCAELEQALQESRTAAPVQQSVPGYGAEQELEAYRRAERAERVARERAELVYHQTNSILSEATAKVDDAACVVGAVADQVSGQLKQLLCAVDSSRLALKDAAATMEQIRPSSDN